VTTTAGDDSVDSPVEARGEASRGEAIRPADPSPSDPGRAPEPPGAELRTYTASAATLWLSQSPALSIWRGEVAAPDRLRIETRDGGIHELRLEPQGSVLHLGRAERVGEERNELVYPDVASRLAATLRNDGVRWWIRRRQECSVPVQVGARALVRGEEAPLVHGTFVAVGGMRATLVDRRYVAPTVPAGTVDAATGLLGRAGLEQEVAAFLQRQRTGGLLLLKLRTALPCSTRAPLPGEPRPTAASLVVALHRAFPSLVVSALDDAAALLVPGDAAALVESARVAAIAVRAAGIAEVACGHWTLAGDGIDAGREVELARSAFTSFAEPAAALPEPLAPPMTPRSPLSDPAPAVALRELTQGARVADPAEIAAAAADPRRATLLFAIEEQSALGGVGPHVIRALERELSAVVASHARAPALIARLAPGVVAASVLRKADPAALGAAVQCDWHARPPITDGKVELPRTLSWEAVHAEAPDARAAELSRECGDPHGVLSALSGGLPYPIAGRVHAAIAASSAVERVKMLFDVLEGAWRFIATVLASASFARRSEGDGASPPAFAPVAEVYRRLEGRDGYALGTWRELARAAARGFEDKGDPIGAMAREVLDVRVDRLDHNQTFETLSNLMQAERNGFAHGHYGEARAAADLPEFEQMTRTLLRALRPLCAWTLVTVEKTEPDLYGELQMVDFVDHTGPFHAGSRRRIGLNSPTRLANVVYLARFREGLVLPLDPMVRRLAHDDRFDLYWMDHLPRAGPCHMSRAVGAGQLRAPVDARRLAPLLRALLEERHERPGSSER
jgi:hypothetical protein